MELNEEISAVKKLVQIILKAKKTETLYLPNNPIYKKIFEEASEKFSEFLGSHGDLKLNIGKDDIFFDGESVYHHEGKHDNLALLFFKDGLRELTFKKGLRSEEFQGFVRIIALDFDQEAVDEDIVTLLWESDFQNIEYVIDESYLTDEEDHEANAVIGLQRSADDRSDLKIVHNTLCSEASDERTDAVVFSITNEDYDHLLKELSGHGSDKTDKFFSIIFELLFLSDRDHEYQETANIFMKTIEYSVKNGNLYAVTDAQEKLKRIVDNKAVNENARECAAKILLFTGGVSTISLLGALLESNTSIEKEIIEKYVSNLGANAVPSFINILKKSTTIHARKLIINALVYLGAKNPSSLYEHLNDPLWYVVRNIVHIIGRLGDVQSVNHVLKALKHSDIRVRKEVVRTLGQLGGDKALAALKGCCQDKDPSMRKYTLNALGVIGSQAAKKIIMDIISNKGFRDMPLEDKKEYFEVLAKWGDNEVYDFLVRIIKKRTLLGRAKNYEMQACAAYCLGLIGKSDGLPILNACRTASNRLLRECSHAALKRIEGGA